MPDNSITNVRSLFTVSREDIHDYRRCPKIVAIKTYRSLRTRALGPDLAHQKTGRLASIIGRIGEVAAEFVFMEDTAIDAQEELGIAPTTSIALSGRVFGRLEQRMRYLDETVRTRIEAIAKQTIIGLESIRSSLQEAYGETLIVGRGEARYGLLPTLGQPDFVAVSSMGKPVLVEVKNTHRQNRSHDRFQASFYNSLQSSVGVAIQKSIADGGSDRVSGPRMVAGSDAETLIVYPRLGIWERVTETLDFNHGMFQDVWRAKQLGATGQVPETECDSKCAHRKLKSNKTLPDGNLEVAKPLALIMARGSASLGVDLDERFYHDHIAKYAPDVVRTLLRLGAFDGRHRDVVTGQLESILMNRFRFSQETATVLLQQGVNGFGMRGMVGWEEVTREMASDLEPWQKILPLDLLDRLNSSAFALGTRIYSLPSDSSVLIQKAWDAWAS